MLRPQSPSGSSVSLARGTSPVPPLAPPPDSLALADLWAAVASPPLSKADLCSASLVYSDYLKKHPGNHLIIHCSAPSALSQARMIVTFGTHAVTPNGNVFPISGASLVLARGEGVVFALPNPVEWLAAAARHERNLPGCVFCAAPPPHLFVQADGPVCSRCAPLVRAAPLPVCERCKKVALPPGSGASFCARCRVARARPAPRP